MARQRMAPEGVSVITEFDCCCEYGPDLAALLGRNTLEFEAGAGHVDRLLVVGKTYRLSATLAGATAAEGTPAAVALIKHAVHLSDADVRALHRLLGNWIANRDQYLAGKARS